jgi:SAM-dependent methyltransferase
MKEIDKNKAAWNLLAEDHYHNFKKKLEEENILLNDNIVNELGDIKDKTLVHLQCNTGSDTISLVRLGLKEAKGIDLADKNIYYANQLKKDFNIDNLEFVEGNVLEADKIIKEKFDIVFTSEGALGWLPDIKKWAKVVSSLLKSDGFFYVYDSHPIFHVFDEELIGKENRLVAKYDYFNAKADIGYEIGGYAGSEKHAENYWWNHTLSDIVNALIEAGLEIVFLNEYDTLFWDNGNMKNISKTIYRYEEFKNKLPFSFSIKAIKKEK